MTHIDLIIDDQLWTQEKTDQEWQAFFQNLADHVLVYEKPHLETLYFSVLLTNDLYTKNLNKEYRCKDKPTNVLSFPAADFDMAKRNPEIPVHLGDIVMAFETIKAEAMMQKKSLLNHVSHLFIHGLLHLLGYDHINDHDATIMEGKEIEYLKAFNIQNPYTEVE